MAEVANVPSVDTPSPPFVLVDGIHNFRDVGGYPLSDRKTSFRRGIIYRCADPSRITIGGKKKLSDLGVTTIFDLRSKPEIDKQLFRTPIPDINGVERQFVPAFADVDYSPENIALRYQNYAKGGPEGFTKAYKDILEHAHPSFRIIFLHLRDHPAKPCVIHCSAGKDRTGVIVALVMSIVGASDETIAMEYELTDIGLAPMRPIIVQHILSEPAFIVDREAVLRMVSAKSENMLATLEMIRKNYGSAEGYARTRCGLSDEDIKTIRKNLTSADAPVL